jgi:hypothetical protein
MRARLGTLHSVVIALVCAWPLAASASATLRAPQILHVEALLPSERLAADGSTHMTFEVFGRRFELELQPNERLSAILNPGTSAQPMRGTIQGMPHSWVRLTRTATGLTGALFDGRELYAVEPSRDAAPFSVEALSRTSPAPVIYRLADMLLPDGLGICGAAPAGRTPGAATAALTGMDAFHALAADLQAAAAQLPTKQLDVGVVADFEMFNFFDAQGIQVADAVAARMNIVDGIFSSQVGIKINTADLTVIGVSKEPFTAPDANTLLKQLRTWRAASAHQLAFGITHLMTGRDMTGDTVGIAYIGAICTGSFGASLSEGWRSTINAALIAAHEIGHNFGAPHDGDPAGACATTPITFLMAAQINGNDQFSPCSLEQMRPVIAGASCLSAVALADAALEIPSPSPHATVAAAFDFSFTVRSVGTATETAVSTSLALPAGLTSITASAQGGSCTSGAGSVDCALGDLPSGDARLVTLKLSGANPGSFASSVMLAAANDSNATNDSASITFNIDAAAPVPAAAAPASGGGGGALGADTLVALALLLASRARYGRSRALASVRSPSRHLSAAHWPHV